MTECPGPLTLPSRLPALRPLTARSALEAVVAADMELMELRAEEKLLNEQLQDPDAARAEDPDFDAGHAQERLNEVYERMNQIGSSTAESRASKILHGLGFTPIMQKRATQSFRCVCVGGGGMGDSGNGGTGLGKGRGKGGRCLGGRRERVLQGLNQREDPCLTQCGPLFYPPPSPPVQWWLAHAHLPGPGPLHPADAAAPRRANQPLGPPSRCACTRAPY